jgi:hypothetical protein
VEGVTVPKHEVLGHVCSRCRDSGGDGLTLLPPQQVHPPLRTVATLSEDSAGNHHRSGQRRLPSNWSSAQLGSRMRSMWGGLHTRKHWLQRVVEHPYLWYGVAWFGATTIYGGLRLWSWHVIKLSLTKTISHLLLNLFPELWVIFLIFHLPDRSLSSSYNLHPGRIVTISILEILAT